MRYGFIGLGELGGRLATSLLRGGFELIVHHADRGRADKHIAMGARWADSSGTSFAHETEGQLILNGSYDIGFTMDLALKDLSFAMKFGQELGVPLDLATLTFETFRNGKAAYGGQAQSTQVVKLLEDALGTDLRAPGFPARLE